jgi:hypothetical protein
MADIATGFTSFETRRPPSSAGLGNSIILSLVIEDSDILHQLRQFSEGSSRDAFALSAMKIGVLALRQAQGQVDAETLRQEGQHLMSELKQELTSKVIEIDHKVAGTLRTYFDPNSGSFTERVQRLIQKDGDLDRVLREKIGDAEESELARTLAKRIGENSPLMKRLSPEDADGVVSKMSAAVESVLAEERQHILAQFSLDSESSALTRVVKELQKQNGELTGSMTQHLQAAVREFSLDDENSALSRLVKQVDSAQLRITNEFSQDNEHSAMSRMNATLAATRRAIEDNLTLDNEGSALSLLSRQLNGILSEIQLKNDTFHKEMGATVAQLLTKRQESMRSTAHGNDFEGEFCSFVQQHVQGSGDVFTATGARTGALSNCKKGDAVLEMGSESAAAGEKIVLEAKERAGYTLLQARAEIDEARKNREASIGVFVFSKQTAPGGQEPLKRIDKDVFVIWDQNDASTDVFVIAALSLARALVFRHSTAEKKSSADFNAMDRCINSVEKQLAALDEMETWAKTIYSNGEKICKKASAVKKCISEELESLRESLETLRTDVAEA